MRQAKISALGNGKGKAKREQGGSKAEVEKKNTTQKSISPKAAGWESNEAGETGKSRKAGGGK